MFNSDMNLTRLRDEVERLAPRDADFESRVQKLLNRFQTASSVLDLVEEYIATLPTHGDPLTYWHPNGFHKITILRRSCGTVDVRAHAWPRVVFPESRPSQWPHNHQWDYWSRIIAGEFEHLVYHVEDGPNCPSHHRFVRSSVCNDNSCILEKRGSANLAETAAGRVNAGEIVHLRATATHAINPIGEPPALTLILLKRIENPEPVTMYVDAIDHRIALRGERRALTKSELEKVSAVMRNQLARRSTRIRSTVGVDTINAISGTPEDG